MARKKISGEGAVNVNPFKLDALEVERLRVKLAKQANQRLVRLERRKAPSGERLSDIGIAQYAYEQIKAIKHVDATKSGKLRFREGKVSDISSARQELFVLQSFLGQETSKAGTAARYVSKTEEHFMQYFNIKMAKGEYTPKAGNDRLWGIASYKSFYNFLNSSAFAALTAAGLDSNQVIDLYNKAHEEKGMGFTAMNKAIDEYVTAMENNDGALTISGLQEALGVSLVK